MRCQCLIAMDANASQGTGHRRSPVAACLPRDVACTLIRRLPEHLSHDRHEAITAGFKAEAFSSAIKSDVSSFIAKCIVIATCSGMGSDPRSNSEELRPLHLLEVNQVGHGHRQGALDANSAEKLFVACRR